jgi:hypothetical protein
MTLQIPGFPGLRESLPERDVLRDLIAQEEEMRQIVKERRRGL